MEKTVHAQIKRMQIKKTFHKNIKDGAKFF